MAKFETYTVKRRFSLNLNIKDSITFHPGTKFTYDGLNLEYRGKKCAVRNLEKALEKRGWAVKGSLKGIPAKKSPVKMEAGGKVQESDPLKNLDSAATGRSDEKKIIEDMETFKPEAKVIGKEEPRRQVVNMDDMEVAKVTKTAGEEKSNAAGVELESEKKADAQVVHQDQNVVKETSYDKKDKESEGKRKPLVVDADSVGVEVRKVTKLNSSPEAEKAEELERVAYVEEKSIETSYEREPSTEVTSSTTPTKKAPSKKAPLKKASSKKAPSKKAAAKKAAAKKAPSKKATAKKKAAGKPTREVEEGAVYSKTRSFRDNSSREATRLGIELPDVRLGSSDDTIISGGAQVSSEDFNIDI